VVNAVSSASDDHRIDPTCVNLPTTSAFAPDVHPDLRTRSQPEACNYM
jgi:hypothetical protein